MPHILPWLAYGTGDGGTAEVRIQARRTVYGSLKAEPGLRRDRCAVLHALAWLGGNNDITFGVWSDIIPRPYSCR
jgi:hypothetical protein